MGGGYAESVGRLAARDPGIVRSGRLPGVRGRRGRLRSPGGLDRLRLGSVRFWNLGA